ncbi:MAG: glyoxalase [Saprospiraceae bacterium]
MSNRDQNLKSLRPLIPTISEKNITSESEHFQNVTLRPILKLQHDLLIQIFHQYTIHRKNVFQKLSPEKKLEYIEHSIRKDLTFRSLLIGTIVGHFTTEEYQIYAQQETELRKRLINMLIERIKSHW